ncbi:MULTISPECIES: hypothetical protein [unclassified Streptomyces]|uniref:hypothetical protein n=1 Tax=unclassified Streptomyces TaxID=2593676 RepID=UPI0009404A2C|nr:hypothetical protein [Streptomyces sp. TSRI0107]OKJ79564.1 hypothetical protein AMK31_26305 [Streptomyces sp. TSRI0107]
MSAETLAAQAAAFTCLAGLAVGRPALPAAYITISGHSPREVSVQLRDPSAVEAWREALDVAPERVVADRIGDRPSLEFTATAYGIDFHVYATYTPASVPAGGAA